MQIRVLGATRVCAGDDVLVGGRIAGVKPRQILEILAISGDSPVSKDRLADLIWDGHPPRSHLGTLESYVCVLRRGLGRRDGIITVPQGYQLDPQIRVDLTTFRSLVRASRTGSDPAASLAMLEQALDLVEGDLLVDEAHASWAIEERGRFEQELVAAAGLAASLALADGRPEVACRHARTALAHDQLAEHVWRILMQGLHASGRRSEALRAFFQLRDLLADELGSDPSRATTDLYLDLLREDAPTSDHAGARASDEVRMLLDLLHQAVLAVPGVRVPAEGDAWLQVAAGLVKVPAQKRERRPGRQPLRAAV